ncbi:hypothetical protein AX14_005183 [Amanita brunnescens Koide BX004]|nr:hypothetical protein AX14_005183 [Amanita brunnescens Koide BX004]
MPSGRRRSGNFQPAATSGYGIQKQVNRSKKHSEAIQNGKHGNQLESIQSSPSSPRLSSSSKDTTVCAYTAFVNVVKRGGAGTSAKGMKQRHAQYTARSDGISRVWDATLVLHSTC